MSLWVRRLAEALVVTVLAVVVLRCFEVVLGPVVTASLLNPLAMILLAAYRPKTR